MNMHNMRGRVQNSIKSVSALFLIALMTVGAGCDSGDSDSGGGGGGTVVTQAEYDEIENGMSYDQVVAIIGAEGKAIVNVGTLSTTYEWVNSNGSYAGVQISSTIALGIGVVQKYNSGNLP